MTFADAWAKCPEGRYITSCGRGDTTFSSLRICKGRVDIEEPMLSLKDVFFADWSVEEPPSMDFAAAMRHLLEGRRVRRRIYPPSVGFSLENLYGGVHLEYGAVAATDWEVVND